MAQTVFLGDSNLARLTKLRQFKVSFHNSINLCQSGAGVADGVKLLSDFVQSEVACTCDTIVILLGTNDINSEAGFSRSSFKILIKICRKYFSRIFLCKIPASPKFDLVKISEINRWLNGFQSVDKITIVDSFTPFLDKPQFFQRFYPSGRPDKVHFSRFGLHVLLTLVESRTNSVAQ